MWGEAATAGRSLRGAVCSCGGNAAEWDRGSVRAGGCGRSDGVARRGQARGGGSQLVRDRCLDLLCALSYQRPDGSFRARHESTLLLDSTCFAVLFLSKSSAPAVIPFR